MRCCFRSPPSDCSNAPRPRMGSLPGTRNTTSAAMSPRTVSTSPFAVALCQSATRSRIAASSVLKRDPLMSNHDWGTYTTGTSIITDGCGSRRCKGSFRRLVRNGPTEVDFGFYNLRTPHREDFCIAKACSIDIAAFVSHEHQSSIGD